MVMETDSENPAQFITPAMLNAFPHKPVTMAGKVTSVNDASLVLQGGDQGSVTVVRAKPAQVLVEVGMNVMVRGFVNQDLSLAESKRFPATDLGENFGTSFAGGVSEARYAGEFASTISEC